MKQKKLTKLVTVLLIVKPGVKPGETPEQRREGTLVVLSLLFIKFN